VLNVDSTVIEEKIEQVSKTEKAVVEKKTKTAAAVAKAKAIKLAKQQTTVSATSSKEITNE
ncbi:MAG: hypothetical protein QMC62_12335, partial [Alteromonadaceae bacterium]